jgi:hypothetical protein
MQGVQTVSWWQNLSGKGGGSCRLGMTHLDGVTRGQAYSELHAAWVVYDSRAKNCLHMQGPANEWRDEAQCSIIGVIGMTKYDHSYVGPQSCIGSVCTASKIVSIHTCLEIQAETAILACVCIALCGEPIASLC